MGGTGDHRWYDEDPEKAWMLQRLDDHDISQQEYDRWLDTHEKLKAEGKK